MTTINSVREFCAAEASMMERCGNPTPPGFLWRSISGLLLHHGREFAPAPLPKGIRRGRMGECYSNAGRIAADRSDLFYCEGYALRAGLIPLPHGWLCDKAGTLIEPTWEHDEGNEYFGVVIKTQWLRKRTMEAKHWGAIFETWREDYPIMTAPASEWKQEL